MDSSGHVLKKWIRKFYISVWVLQDLEKRIIIALTSGSTTVSDESVSFDD